MSAEMSTSEVLNKAADLIEQHGWATGPQAWSAHEGGGLCLEGGILAAIGLDRDDATQRRKFRSCDAYRAVKDYLVSTDDLEGDAPLWEFNDSSAEERVIGVLRATALIESARERESVEV